MSDEPASSSGVQLGASGDVNIGGDVVGRDKITNVTNVYNVVAPAQAGAGLEALGELLQHSAEARAAAAAFQADFLAAQAQLTLLSDYKLLHDVLHRLQFQCFNSIAQAAPRFPDDELAADQLNDYKLTLETLDGEAQQVASRAVVPKADVAWLTDLAAARGDLQSAVEALDAKLLTKVLWRLNRVLNQYPARINSLLNQAARALRLPTLVAALQQVAEHVQGLKLEPEKVDQFMIGVDALSILDIELGQRVDEHDQWQAVDQGLRLIDNALEHDDLAELEMSWPDLKLKAEPLSAGEKDWAAGLRKDATALDEVLPSGNPAKIKRQFRAYRRRAGERFFRVDVNLKDLCERLRLVSAPLASVTQLIQ